MTEVLHPFPITAIYASPFRRAYQTVELLAARLKIPIQTIPDLRERQLAGGPIADFTEAVAVLWRAPSFAHPGGESNLMAQQRGMAVINELRQDHPTDPVVLATHGNLMALILQHFDRAIDYEFWRALRIPDIYRLRLHPAGQADIRRIWGSD